MYYHISVQKIVPCLWFDTNAEEAIKFYSSIFKDSKIGAISHYGKEGFEIHHMPEGAVLTIEFELNGQKFLALNGGPVFKFNEAVSLLIYCEDQKEVDYYWDSLTRAGGQESRCGWLKDKFGLSWQIIPTVLPKLLSDPVKGGAVMQAMLAMHKIIIADLEKACTL